MTEGSGNLTTAPPPVCSRVSAPAGEPLVSLPRIDGYTVTKLLGVGGMGVVWRATQFGTHRDVALKMISTSAFDSPNARARFDREVEIAARLEHPNIARVYASGVDRGGSCYYAMELIEGLPLDAFAKQRNLDDRSVLQIMRDVARAVAYAHRRGIIHRDLKPSNIVVDESGQPHVLDFGLARTVFANDACRLSLHGELAGTPAFMSPEQAAGHFDVLDTRADVYSLGVILYLLLTKRHPHGDGVPSIELMRRISEFDARPARAVRPKIDADLNLLLAKSLARDPAQRYQSADALAQDIEHYLRGDPIAARPPTLSYLFGRRIRTHRRAVAVVSAFFAVVLAVLMAASVRLARERAQTEAQAQRLRRLVELFQQVLRPTDQPKTANGRDKRLDTLDATALRVAALAGAPDVEAGIRDTLGQAYYDNQRFNRAAEQFRIAKQLREHTLGHDHPETLASAHRLGRFLLDRHQPAEAAELLRHTFQGRVAKLGPQHLDTQASQVYLADALAAQGDWLEATELALPTLAMRLNLFSTDVPPIMSAFGYRTKVLADPSVAPVAKRFYETERERRVEEFGKHSREAAIVTLLLGEIELNQNRRGLALKRFRQAYDGFMQSVRPDDPYPAICVDRIVHLTSERGVTSEGFTKAMNLLEWRREVLGPDDPSTLTFESDCAMYMNCWSLSKRGIEIRRELLPRQIRVLGKDHPSTLYSMRALAQCMCAHRVNGDEALDLARESYDRSQTTFGAGDLFVSRGLTVLQEVLIRQGHSATAVARGDEYRKVLEFRFGPTDIRTHQFVIESAQTMDRARESGAASAALLSLLLRECSAPSDVHRQVRETRGELQRIEVHRALRWCRNQSRQFAARVPVDVVQRYEMPPGALAAR